LHISLAAKCQLLFGAAVVMIIAAALFVPWQRMEQLTEQLNDAAASAVADAAVRHHVATAAAPSTEPSTSRPTTTDPRGQSRLVRLNGKDSFAPRLVGLTPDPAQQLTPWEHAVLSQLQKEQQTRTFSRKY